MIHGAGGNYLYWPPQVRRLQGYNIYALDLPGHGKSSGPGEQTIRTYHQRVIEWMQAVSVFRPVVIGHSMGGAIALSIGIHEPDRVRALGLISTGARLRVDPETLENIAQEATYSAALNQITRSWFAPGTDAQLLEEAAERLTEVRPSVLQGDYAACDGFDVMGQIDSIQLPSLILCGSEDVLTPPRYSRFLAGKMPNARLSIVPDSGHMVILERPETVAAELKAFVDSVP